MKHYLYIISDHKRMLHCGFCTDIKKAIEFYNAMPTLLPAGQKLCNLVYVADCPNKESAQHHFENLSKQTKAEKIITVESINPTWMDLVPGVNIEL